MNQPQRKFLISTIYVGLLLFSSSLLALEFEPGIGGGLGYSDNIRLTSDNEEDDLIAVGYVGARLEHDSGPIQADASAALNHVRYTKDTFPDQRYFNLRATADWEMVENRIDWRVQNYYRQIPIETIDSNTPVNIQDTNSFIFGADFTFLVSGRQTFSLRPEYRNFYYESSLTDNQQYALMANWNYQMYRLTSVGLSTSVRTLVYEDPGAVDVTFTNLYFVASVDRARSDITVNLGYNGVKRENGQLTSEPAGSLNWQVNLTNRSHIRTFFSTGLNDTSSATYYAVVDPGVGNPNIIQESTDVIRNTGVTLGYHRTDRTLGSSITGELRELTYSESPNDRRIKLVNASLSYPVSALLSTELFARFRNTELTDTNIKQQRYFVGVNFAYQISRNLRSQFDLVYLDEESNDFTLDYSAWNGYVNLVYGFGRTLRPGRLSGF